MDDQQNQAQPGQSFQPGQSVQPGQMPQQPVAPQPQQAAPQPVAPQPQQQFQQPQQAYAQPQQPMPQQPGVDPLQQQAAGPGSQLNIKKMGMIGGIFLGVVILFAVIAAVLGGGGSGSSLPLVETTSAEVTVSASVPEGWAPYYSSEGTLSFLSASPIDQFADDETSVFVSRTSNAISNEAFNSQADSEMANTASRQFANNFNVVVTQLALDRIDDRTFSISYVQTPNASGIPHNIVRYFRHAEDDSMINIRLAYTDNYLELANSAQAIIDSVTIK